MGQQLLEWLWVQQWSGLPLEQPLLVLPTGQRLWAMRWEQLLLDQLLAPQWWVLPMGQQWLVPRLVPPLLVPRLDLLLLEQQRGQPLWEPR